MDLGFPFIYTWFLMETWCWVFFVFSRNKTILFQQTQNMLHHLKPSFIQSHYTRKQNSKSFCSIQPGFAKKSVAWLFSPYVCIIRISKSFIQSHYDIFWFQTAEHMLQPYICLEANPISQSPLKYSIPPEEDLSRLPHPLGPGLPF